MNTIEIANKEFVNKALTGTKPFHINTTTVYTALNGYAIKAIKDTTFTTLVTPGMGGDDDLVSDTLLVGDTWYVPVDDVTIVAGGSVIVYRF